MRLSDGLPGRTHPEDAHPLDDAASRARLFTVLWHTARGLVLVVAFSVLLDQLHLAFAWLARHGPHPALGLGLVLVFGIDVFVCTTRWANRGRRRADDGEVTLWLVCAGFALLANVSANLLIHRVVGDPALAPVFIPLLAIAALYVLIVLGACAAIGFRHGSPVRRVARWMAVVALVGVPFAMLAPGWWLAVLIGSIAVAHAIDQMVGFAVRHPGATHRDLATCLVATSCVAPALLAWRLGRWVTGCEGRQNPASR